MPDPNILEKIHLNNVEYNLKDNISGYTTNTGTVTQISTGTGLSGGPITTSGTISHANSGVTAQTTQALYPFTVNATGHITGVGSAVTPITDVQVGGTSIVSSGEANIVTNTAYNASTNKIATMADVDVMTITYSLISGTDYEMNISTVLAPNYANTILGEEY